MTKRPVSPGKDPKVKGDLNIIQPSPINIYNPADRADVDQFRWNVCAPRKLDFEACAEELTKIAGPLSEKALSWLKNAYGMDKLKDVIGKEAELIKYTKNKDGDKVIDLHETGKALKAHLNIVFLKDRKDRTITERYYDRNTGLYREGVKDVINITLESLLKNSAVTNLKNEIYAHIRDQGFEYLDKWLTKNKPHVVVKNGVLNLQKFITGENPLEEWSPEWHTFNALDIEYDPKATGELFRKHIDLVIPEHSDQTAFHKFVGSFLESSSYAHQKIFVLYGKEGAGKTITLRTLAKFFGIENITAKSFQELAEGRFHIADLFGALANICEELPKDVVRQISRLNSLTGGLVDGEKKNRDPFAFYQNAKIAAACNDLPELNGDTTTIRAFMSRVIIITFNLVIRGTDKEIPNYDDVMLEDKSGILNWILEGYKAYMDAGKRIQSSKSTDETFDYYIANSDFITYFLNGCTYQGSTEGDFVIKRELYQAYLKAARMRDAVTLGEQSFKGNVRQKCKWTLLDGRHEINGKQEHTFDGIKLKPEKYWFTDIDSVDYAQEPYTPKIGGKGGNSQEGLPGLPSFKGVSPSEEDDRNSDGNLDKSTLQNEKSSIDETEQKPIDLRSAILDLIETEAPGSKYHSLTPKAIYDMLVLKFPLVTQSEIAKICKREYDRGVLRKPGLGYMINPDGPGTGGIA